jgi:dihydrodipicolinate synthase/N-acetylneuraminate lyase
MKRHVDLRGILVAMVTPLTPDGSAVDEDGLRRHVDWLMAEGIHGLVPSGSTGELPTLRLDERKRVIELTLEAADGRVPVVPCTAALATADAVELSRFASQAGAAGVMIVPPFYSPPGPAALRAYLSEISAAVDVPIVYYNLPGVTGVRLSAAELAALAEIEGVEYLKDTSGDAVSLTALLLRHGEHITAFNGWDTLTFYGLALGARAAIWGTANLIPRLAVQLWEALGERADLEEGRQLWRRIWPICDFLEAHEYVAGVKAGMELIGRPAGPARRPVLPLDAGARSELAGLLRGAGLTPAIDV